MKRVATIILNRNLPEITDRLYDHIQKFDGDLTDIYILESGSNSSNLSKNHTWHADTPEAMKHGLRYCRGMNFALSKLWNNQKFHSYDAFFLITNDTELEETSSISKLMKILDDNQKIGLLSPCADDWGEKQLLEEKTLKYFWYIHNSAYFLRREFIESICHQDNPNFMNFLFDGNNFRGYQADTELIAKGYVNDWASAITSEVRAKENEAHLLTKSDLIKTETFDDNMSLYIEEGHKWMKSKYGFSSRWSFQLYTKLFYDKFFEFHPELIEYRL